MRPLKVGGLFTGVGAHHEALKAMDLPGGYEVVFQCEADPRTASAYDLAHGPTPNLGDVRDIESLDAWPVDLLVASPPCQDISVAGKGAGLGEGTRSGLIREVPRIVAATAEDRRPRCIVWEDVPALVYKAHVGTWMEVVSDLEACGYRTAWKVMNAADYGVAQSRRRLFAVSMLGAEPPPFPDPRPLEKSLRDYLDPEPVEPRYYLSEERIRGLAWSTEREREKGNGFAFRLRDPAGNAGTVTTKEGSRKTSTYLEVRR